MIVEFTVGNFLSFKENRTLSLEATNITEHKESVFKKGNYSLLKSSVLYGANSSGVLVIDELDAKFHPLMTAAITNLFNSPEYNTENAQLIFATHDTNLLSYGKFRRDQIYFLEKDRFEASDLYSLIEYKEDGSKTKIRKDRSFEKDYINGRYGAIPFIGNFEELLRNGSQSLHQSTQAN